MPKKRQNRPRTGQGVSKAAPKPENVSRGQEMAKKAISSSLRKRKSGSTRQHVLKRLTEQLHRDRLKDCRGEPGMKVQGW